MDTDYDLDSGIGGGLGLEMLMNRNAKSDSKKFFSGNNLDDVTNLDQTLNDLSGGGGGEMNYRGQSGFFSGDAGAGAETTLGDIPLYESNHINFNETPAYDDTMPSGGDMGQTWDDYGKYQNIPGDGQGAGGGGGGAASEEAITAEKMDLLRKLESRERDGAKLLKKYTLTDSLAEMRAELKALDDEIQRRANISFYKKTLVYSMHSLEWLNGNLRPIDGFTLDGFTSELEEAINGPDYEEVLAELYEKYKTQLKVWPELKLLFLLGGGVAAFNFRKNMARNITNLASAMMNQYPDANQMAEQAMMQSMLNGGSGDGMPQQPPSAYGAAPPQYNPRFGAPLPPQNQRPPDPPMRTRSLEPTPMAATAGARYNGPPPQASVAPSGLRPEMQGPRDLNSLFSGMGQSRTATAAPQSGGGIRTRVVDIPVVNDDADTVVTVDDIKPGGALPRRTGGSGGRRSRNNEKNITL